MATVLPRLRDIGRRHPEWEAVVLAVTAWVAVIVWHGGPATEAGHAGHGEHGGAAPHAGHAGHGASWITGIGTSLLFWVVMVAAMMIPVTVPAVRHVARNSLRWRRRRAIGGFLMPYLAVWAIAGLVAVPVIALMESHMPPGLVVVGLLVVAAAWQLLPYHRRFLRDCHRTVPLPPRGRRATLGCARFGIRHGFACVGLCWPLMLLMAAARSWHLVWMVALTAVVAFVKLRVDKQLAGTRLIGGPLAAGLGGLAVVLFAAS